MFSAWYHLSKMMIYISGFADGSIYSSYLRITDKIVQNNLGKLCASTHGIKKVIGGLTIKYQFENATELENLRKMLL